MTEATHEKQSSAIRKVEFKCAKCGELDHIKLYESEPVPPAVNCWHCHAGLRMDVAQMIETHRGMFPVTNQDGTLKVETYIPALS